MSIKSKWKWFSITIVVVLMVALLVMMLPTHVSINTDKGIISIGLSRALADTSTRSPTTNTGSAWTNPTRAYDDNGAGYANITANNPSGSNVWGTYGFSLTGNTITQVRVRYDAWSVGTFSTISLRAVGTPVYGTAALQPAVPAAQLTGDMMLCLLGVKPYSDTPTIDQGWASIGSATDGTVAAGIDVGSMQTRIFYKIATADPETNPTITDANNNVSTAVIIVFQKGANGTWVTPVGAGGGDATAGTDFSVTASSDVGHTTGDMVVAAASFRSDAATPTTARNVTITGCSLTYTQSPATDPETTSGGDMGMTCGYATVNSGTSSAAPVMTATLAAAHTGSAYLVRLRTTEYNDKISVDVSWNGGTNWSNTQNTTLTSAEVTTWYDVTAATAWTPAKLADGQLQVRALAQLVNNAEQVRLDWLPVEVNYTLPEPIIGVAPAIKDFGYVAESSTTNTTTTFFSLSNNSTIQTDQTISVTTANWSGGVEWIHSNTATAGNMTAGLNANRGGTWGPGGIVVQSSVTGTPQYIYENCPIDEDYQFGLSLIAPNNYTDGIEKQIVVRITAVSG